MILDFDEIVFPAKDLDETSTGGSGLFPPVVHQVLGDQGSETTCKADQPVGIFRQRLYIRAWFVVKTLQVRVGDQFEEILVSGKVSSQQTEVKHGFALV